MKITSEKALRDFNFWSGAETNVAKLTYMELERIENMLEDINPDGMTETEVNDYFWFDFESICEWLGTTEEEVNERE